jgi:hypothetical protein
VIDHLGETRTLLQESCETLKIDVTDEFDGRREVMNEQFNNVWAGLQEAKTKLEAKCDAAEEYVTSLTRKVAEQVNNAVEDQEPLLQSRLMMNNKKKKKNLSLEGLRMNNKKKKKNLSLTTKKNDPPQLSRKAMKKLRATAKANRAAAAGGALEGDEGATSASSTTIPIPPTNDTPAVQMVSTLRNDAAMVSEHESSERKKKKLHQQALFFSQAIENAKLKAINNELEKTNSYNMFISFGGE